MFSRRLGFEEIPKTLQLYQISEDLKNRLWNYIVLVLFRFRDPTAGRNMSYFVLCKIFDSILKEPIDRLEFMSSYELQRAFKEKFFAIEWFKIYNILESIYKLIKSYPLLGNQEQFTEQVNIILENEYSGYRLLSGSIAPITSKSEIQIIEEVVVKSKDKNLDGVTTHILTALHHLSSKPIPDLRNSVKESLAAVESIACLIAKTPKADLSTAFKTLKNQNRIEIHKALLNGFDSLYGYASDDDGIRHKLIDISNLKFEDAQFMVVSCSAFVNYLIQKAERAGIDLKTETK